MPYMILMQDKPEQGKQRAETRNAHLDYLDANKSRLLAAGAVLDDAGAIASGSMYIVDTDDRKEAERFAADDPFHKAGIFAKVTVMRWRKSFFNGQRLV